MASWNVDNIGVENWKIVKHLDSGTIEWLLRNADHVDDISELSCYLKRNSRNLTFHARIDDDARIFDGKEIYVVECVYHQKNYDGRWVCSLLKTCYTAASARRSAGQFRRGNPRKVKLWQP